jgi:hypothetical protein
MLPTSSQTGQIGLHSTEVHCTSPWWWWVWSSLCNENWQRKLKCSQRTCPSAALSTTNPTWPDLDSNPGRPCNLPHNYTFQPSTWEACASETSQHCSEPQSEEILFYLRLMVVWDVIPCGPVGHQHFRQMLFAYQTIWCHSLDDNNSI